VFPLLNLLLFIICGLAGDLRRGASGGAVKMGPVLSGSHGLTEVSNEDSPV
jgi:hypothetical protein